MGNRVCARHGADPRIRSSRSGVRPS